MGGGLRVGVETREQLLIGSGTRVSAVAELIRKELP